MLMNELFDLNIENSNVHVNKNNYEKSGGIALAIGRPAL
jgi:hypothetical protein